MKKFLRIIALTALAVGSAAAQDKPAPDKPFDPILTVERLFSSGEFAAERFGPARWMTDGATYTTLEPSAEAKGGRDLVLYDAASGKRSVLVSAAKLVPAGAEGPLAIEDYAWSPDGKVLIVFTNSKRVWRQNTRGDFWTYELLTGRLRQLGRDFEASTLMFAKLSPDGRKAAYVVKNDIYAEDLASGRVVRLTFDGGPDLINGTSDWVNEEEFGIRDGFRWSPDSASIAFWQFDTTRVPVFTMIDNTSALYPATTTFKHPKPGQPNSAVRVGVVPAAGGPTVWMKTPGDPSDTYIARLEWAGNSREVILQHLNRLQNTLNVLVGDAATGAVRTVFTDTDETWVETMDDFVWLDGGKSLLWLSERDGWNHAYAVGRDGGAPRLLTPGDYDVLNVAAVDEKAGWLYVTASPADATKRFLYRARMDGKGKPELVGPAGQSGVHRFDISPTARWAFHSYSRLDEPPVTELVRLPKGEVVRPLAANKDLRAKVDGLSRKRAEYFKLPIGDGVEVDGWRILPPDFDPGQEIPPHRLRLRRAGRPDRPGRLGRQRLPLAPDAGPEGLYRRQLRQPRHPGAPRPGLAQVHLPADRHPGLGRSGRGRPGGHRRLAVRRRGAHRRLGLERRRVHDPQRHVPLSRPVQSRHFRGLRARPAALRHDLPGALHGPAGRQSRRLQERLADHLRQGPRRPAPPRPRHGRRQRPLPGLRAPRRRARGRQPAVFHDGLPEPVPRHL